ncbi:MAG: tRNA (guanosine(37)-N1)-methyltransferase TrmD [Bacteroidetes bacterium]|nr:tRNA (guanosine(37)-N1)-methyltransferase TrmD [Bacteroidota bacterium]
MRLDIITLFPEILNGFFAHSIIKRAAEKGHVKIILHNLRDYSSNKYRSVDDYPFGGGAGMVMMIEPIAHCIRKLKEERDYDEIIYLTPDGKLLDQPLANTLSMKGNMILLCGHYKGVDERVREFFITQEISIGNYVLSGGELPAAVLVDSIIRLIPGVLGNESSALFDSFQNQLLAPPVYTRPRNFEGMEVPPVLLSGNEKEIEEWRYSQSIERTRNRRPGYLE